VIDAEEEANWLVRMRRPMRVVDGPLLIAGGCDPDAYASWFERDEPCRYEVADEVHRFEVPPGDYLLEIFVMPDALVACVGRASRLHKCTTPRSGGCSPSDWLSCCCQPWASSPQICSGSISSKD